MTRPVSRNLWTVRMDHLEFEELFILAPTAQKAAQKAITFTRRKDGVKRPVVKAVKFSGTIDVF